MGKFCTIKLFALINFCRTTIYLYSLEHFKSSVEKDTDKWKKYYDVSNPNEIPCPAPLDKLTGLQRLVALRCIRPDKVVPAVQVCLYIKHHSSASQTEIVP